MELRKGPAIFAKIVPEKHNLRMYNFNDSPPWLPKGGRGLVSKGRDSLFLFTYPKEDDFKYSILKKINQLLIQPLAPPEWRGL